ncbi:hypothetical protein LEMLEM_LOCUS27576 [Lemmus lemmus]
MRTSWRGCGSSTRKATAR